MNIVMVDNGGTNLNSVAAAIQRLGRQVVCSGDAEVISAADRVILPGVGAAPPAMAKLQALGLTQVIPRLQQPVLGICLGMQLLYEYSDEGDETIPCLGLIPGTIRRLPELAGARIPHMGWNRVRPCREDALTRDFPDAGYAYFVHSFAAPVNDYTLATTQHGENFAAMARTGNFWAAQFHPERSAGLGHLLLKTFLSEDLC